MASLLGKLEAAFPAVQYGPLHYRKLEKDKIMALKKTQGHFDRPMTISLAARQELMVAGPC